MLVAAAAGSGKTAVLVERIIRKLTDPERPLSVDRLLVATFTKAAAAEMRQRITEALEKELAKDPANAEIGRQLAMLGRASITTLHSFCMEVIQRYYTLIPLDPGFRIASEAKPPYCGRRCWSSCLRKIRHRRTGQPFPHARRSVWRRAERRRGVRPGAAAVRILTQPSLAGGLAAPGFSRILGPRCCGP
ncbi:hypothetical protein HMSSN036_95480 [Paenibacillus macerans]|nr:hypothetical protein HMSSN036_95480 [Paenibacillus macerans]